MNRLNVFYLLMVLSSIVLFSCGSDDDDPTGTYKITSYGTANCDDPSENITLDISSDDGCTMLSGVEFCGTGSITIREDETFSLSVSITSDGVSFSTSGNGSYSLNGNTITVCDDDDCFDGNINGNRLTLSVPSEDGCILTITGEKQ